MPVVGFETFNCWVFTDDTGFGFIFTLEFNILFILGCPRRTEFVPITTGLTVCNGENGAEGIISSTYMMLWDLPSSEGCDENGDDGGLSFCILTQIYKTSKKLINSNKHNNMVYGV